MNKKQLLKTLESMGMRPGRGLGQNFLLDTNLLDWIVRKSKPQAGEKILEVGPGFGALTHKLLDTGAVVTAIEFDHRIAEYLRKNVHHENLTLIENDACQVDYAELFPEGVSYRAIANLPYAISTVFISILSELDNPPKEMYFMLQKEMAERLASPPGCKAYGALSVTAGLRYVANIEKIVPPDVFYPAPEVESAILSLKKRENDPGKDDLIKVRKLVRLVFSQRRKQMGKIIAGSYGKERTAIAMEKCNLDMTIRPDKVSIEKFLELSRTLAEVNVEN